jgi:predicted secreted protein
MSDFLLLDENVTAGYQWEVVVANNVHVIRSEHVPDFEALEKELVGAAGVRVIEHEPIDPGEGWVLSLIYSQPWSPEKPADFRTYVGVKP